MSGSSVFGRFVEATREAFAAAKLDLTIPRVTAALEGLLAEQGFLERDYGILKPGEVGVYVLHKDPEFGFMVKAQGLRPGHRRGPHDHGPGWVVYGTYRNVMELALYERIDGRREDGPAELAEKERYLLHGGQARGHFPGDIHATANPSGEGSVIIRVLSQDLSKVEVLRYDLERRLAVRSPGEPDPVVRVLGC